MKEYFYENNNKVYIIDKDEGIITRDAKDNIEEILITENDLEQLTIMRKIIKNDRNFTNSLIKQEGEKFKIYVVLIILAEMLIFCTTSHFMTTLNVLTYILMGIVLGAFPLSTIFNKKRLKNELKQHDILVEQYETELEKQKNKLNELNKVAKDKIVDSTIIKKVPNSELINLLKKKRYLITHYFNNKKTYISAYKNNELETLLKIDDYSDSDIELIKFLIEEEINKKEKGHQKKHTN